MSKKIPHIALHCGLVGPFVEQAKTFHPIAKVDRPALPEIINFFLDYRHPARSRDTYRQCKLTRQDRAVANVLTKAWQEDSDKHNAIASTHLLLPELHLKENQDGTLET